MRLQGNGRLGRMLVPLFLWQADLIRTPTFYVSSFLEAHRETYYDHLLTVSRDNDWSGWCAFFLQAIIEQATENSDKASRILKLYNEKKTEMVDLTHSQYSLPALDWIFERPIFSSSDFVENAGIPAPTARRILSVFRETGLLTILVAPSGRRAGVYAFAALLNIAEGHDAF